MGKRRTCIEGPMYGKAHAYDPSLGYLYVASILDRLYADSSTLEDSHSESTPEFDIGRIPIRNHSGARNWYTPLPDGNIVLPNLRTLNNSRARQSNAPTPT